MKYRVFLVLDDEATFDPCFDFYDLTEALCFVNFAIKQGYEVKIKICEVGENG
jgi:hypothetical protein